MLDTSLEQNSLDDAWDYFDLLVEKAQVWETTTTIERENLDLVLREVYITSMRRMM